MLPRNSSSSWLECSGRNNVSLTIRMYSITSLLLMSDSALPVWDMSPEDMSPETEWGRMCGLSGDVTLWVLFGGRPGLELKSREHRASSIQLPTLNTSAIWNYCAAGTKGIRCIKGQNTLIPSFTHTHFHTHAQSDCFIWISIKCRDLDDHNKVSGINRIKMNRKPGIYFICKWLDV